MVLDCVASRFAQACPGDEKSILGAVSMDQTIQLGYDFGCDLASLDLHNESRGLKPKKAAARGDVDSAIGSGWGFVGIESFGSISPSATPSCASRM